MSSDLGRSRDNAFRIHLTVAASDLDEMRHVNNVVYVQWVLQAAVAHWETVAPAATRAELAWAARRHEIDYLLPAFLGDEIMVVTWIGGAEGLTFERFAEVRFADGRVAAKSRTLWVPIDPRTGRPKRVSAEVRGLFSV
ncbi:MAG: acyl-CoA thioesterase [Gemmatimonadaceae bacterium]|nr:acyl-CoA thioesterase [Gemmatimonadaceae bacterium]NUQ91280.1 acyl-CoA thioesterase [Gemmatimonadaceae bacterium]NUR21070.1 acyl-CoA thioesterase [Gemmatimonadaceae bacterium]NUS96805.1 acyl-CoA thioesterase [Gemmatimonadaceae bacterium]